MSELDQCCSSFRCRLTAPPITDAATCWVPVPALVPDDRPQLLQRPICARVRCHIDVGQSTRAVLITINTYSIRNVAVTATKKSQATIALAWFFRKVDQR